MKLRNCEDRLRDAEQCISDLEDSLDFKEKEYKQLEVRSVGI